MGSWSHGVEPLSPGVMESSHGLRHSYSFSFETGENVSETEKNLSETGAT
jgi:hypothetical protein